MENKLLTLLSFVSPSSRHARGGHPSGGLAEMIRLRCHRSIRLPLFLFSTLLLGIHASAGDGTVTIGGELKQWHRVDLKQEAVASSEMSDPNPFRNYRFNVEFTAPSGGQYLVPGYFAADGNGGDSGNIWMAHLNPDETGEWSYTISFRSGTDVAVSLDPNAGAALSPYDGMSGTFTVTESDKTGKDFRSPDKGMLVNRGDHYLTYGGSGQAFLYTGPGIPENILGYNGFTNSTAGIGHDFDVHLAHWNNGDPDWNSGAGRKLIGALNYIADQGANSLYLMSNTIGGDGDDCFPHPTTDTTKDRYDLLKLKQWDIALAHGQKKGIFLHWHLSEHEAPNREYYGMGNDTMTVERKLSFRMLNAVFGHYNGLKWNIAEEAEFTFSQRTAQMEYIKAIDPYDHPVTYQVGGAGIPYDTYDTHLGQTNGIDAGSFQGNASRASMFNEMQEWRSKSVANGQPWTVAWDEPQKIENDNSDQVNGYPMGRRDKMWPCIMGGGDGFMWYIQKDGGGHGFDQSIEDFTIMENAFNWSGHIRAFLQDLPLTAMQSSMDIANSSTGNDYALYKTGEVYAVYNDRSGSGMTLDLSGVSGTFTVKWFDPRDGGGLQDGTVLTVDGGGVRNLGSAPHTTGDDWAVLVQATQKIAYIHGDVAEDGTVPSGSADPFHQMLLTDSGNRGLSIFKAMVEAEGHTIEQFYDQDTTLDAAFLDQFDAVIFSLHQKIWSSAEKAALDTWLQAGGGMLIYSDSAAGGLWSQVGAQNTVGQTVVNNLISPYGMEVTVDQANGVKAIRAGPGASHPIVMDRPVLEGEGVSPVAVDPNGSVIRLIPYEDDSDFVVSGTPGIPHPKNITIQNPEYAALALAEVGAGNVIAMFDRQPMWNNGEGSDIEERDNQEILRRIVNFLVDAEAANSPPTADAGADQTVTDDGDGSETVTLDGSGSSDSDGSIASYSWTEGGTEIATGVNPNVTLGVGTHGITLTVTDDDGNVASDTVIVTVIDPTVQAFLEANGIVAFEVESMPPSTPEWQEATSISGFSGDGYFIGQEDHFNQPGLGVVSYPVYISTTGRYQLNWRSRIAVGSDNTEHNDSFARLVDADGNPVTPVANDNAPTNTWYKAYMNQASAWSWQTSNKDNDAHSLSWNLDAGTLYYFQISVRSQGHALDRVVLWDHNQHDFANKTTGKNPNNGALDSLTNSQFSTISGLTVDAGSDQTLFLPDNSAVLDGTVSAPDGVTPTVGWTKESGPGTVTFGDATAVDTSATFGSSGTYVLRLTVDDGTDSAFDEVTINVIKDGDVVAAINSGGGSYTAADGVFYTADTGFSGGNTFDTTDPISGTEDDPLYQTERWGEFTYSIPVANSSYVVTLKLAEIWFEAAGQRLFDIQIEGQTVIDDIDVFTAAGGKNLALEQSFTVEVSDGVLNIQTFANTNNPKLNAILVTSSPADNSYLDWKNGSFTNDFTDTDPTSDPDGDGYPNLLEFAFGMDPTISMPGALEFQQDGSITRPGGPVVWRDSVSPDTFHAVFGRRKDYIEAGLTYTCEFTADLSMWTESSTTPTVLTDSGSNGDIEAVSIPFPGSVPTSDGVDKTTQFFRVKVSSGNF